MCVGCGVLARALMAAGKRVDRAELKFEGGVWVMIGNSLITEAKSVLVDLQRIHGRMEKQKEELKGYGDWILRNEGPKKSTHSYYDVMRSGSKGKKYLGNENNEQVLNVKRYRYADKALELLEEDIRLLEHLIDNYVSPEYKNINDLLPAVYQTNLLSAVSSCSVRGDIPQEAIEWKERLQAEKAKYPLFRPEQLTREALDGTKMRSKSEVLIANFLILAGIPFVYEAPLFINGENLLPDFMILSLIDLSTVIIIEHQGMIFSDNYVDKFIRSLRLYLHTTEWVPNHNLFFTFDNIGETVDMRQLLQILRRHVNPSIEVPNMRHSIMAESVELQETIRRPA